MRPMESLKNNLKSRRVEAGLSQQDLARQAGISRQAYASLESGRSIPSTVVGLRLAQALGTKMESLFSLADPPPTSLQAQLVGSQPLEDGTEAGPASGRTPRMVKLIPVGGRIWARTVPDTMGARYGLVEADGVILPASQPEDEDPPQVEVRPFDQGEIQMPCLSLLGCDPAMVLLENGLRQRGIRFVCHEESSYQALVSLSRGEAHVAGCHLRDRDTGNYNVSWARRLLPFPFTLVTFSTWQQGLMVGRNNPKGIADPGHLARSDVKIANRPQGSGSRDLLDRLLESEGIPPVQVGGYENEFQGHLDLAAAVSNGMADVGVGVQAAANALGLEFLPLEEERYDLAIPNHFLDTPGVQALLDLLSVPGLGRRIEALAGYDASGMGAPVSLN